MPANARRITVSLINSSTVVSDTEVAYITAALQKQVDLHFRPTWGTAARLVAVPKGGRPEPNSWWLVFADDSDQAGALGYHDLTPDLHPVGYVFAATDKQFGAIISVTASHELLEMLGDPYINLTALDPETNRLYAYESSDAVEADGLGYAIDGITVSDFVLPSFFDFNHRGKGKLLSYRGSVNEPFELAPGGYLSFLDLGRLSAGWQQVTAQLGEGAILGHDDTLARQKGERTPGFPVGSRRERRTRVLGGGLVVSEVKD